MNTHRTRMIAKRVIIQFRRDHRTLGLLLVVPVVIITLLAVIIRAPGGTITVGLVNQDTGIVGAALASAMTGSASLNVRQTTMAEAEQQLKDGTIKAAIILTPDLTQTVLSQRSLPIELLLEGSDPVDTAQVMQALAQTAQTALQSAGAAQSGPKVDIQVSYLYGGPQFDALDLFAPAYIPFFVFFLVFLLTCVSFLRERMQGTMERLMATPAGRAEVVVGYTLGFSLFAVLQSLLILLWSVYVLDIHYVGSLWLIFVVEVVVTIVAVGMGIFLSIYARNELQAVQFIPIVIVPQAFLCGLVFPIADLPNWLRPFAYIMPLTYAVQALRDVMVKGFGLVQILPPLIILSALGLATLALASLTLRREIA